MIDEKSLRKVEINGRSNGRSEDLDSKTVLNPIRKFMTDHKLPNTVRLSSIKIERDFIKRTEQQEKEIEISAFTGVKFQPAKKKICSVSNLRFSFKFDRYTIQQARL